MNVATFLLWLALPLAGKDLPPCWRAPTPPVFRAAVTTDNVAERLSATVLTIVCPNGCSGSGVPVVLADGSAWVWTAGHVAACAREEHTLTPIGGDPDLKPRVVVTFLPLIVGRHQVEGLTEVRWVEWRAEVVRYDEAQDLALLRIIEAKPLGLTSARFWPDGKAPPRLGEPVYCAGSPGGKDQHGTVNSGTQSYLGRRWKGQDWDIACACSQPGASGGAVACAHTGEVLGLVQGGPGESVTRYAPTRRIRAWAKSVGVSFALDPTATAPPRVILEKQPIEEVTHRVR